MKLILRCRFVFLVSLIWLQLGSVCLAAGLVDLVASRGAAGPEINEAAAWLASHPGVLQVWWRPWLNSTRWKSTLPWEGKIVAWRPSPAASNTLIGVVSGPDARFVASVQVRNYHGALRLIVLVQARRASNGAEEVVVGCPFQPGSWNRSFYPSGKYIVLPPDRFYPFRFLSSLEDASGPVNGAYNYPFGVLERNNGFLFWGAMSVSQMRWVTPNHMPFAVPCFTYIPRRVSPGAREEFDLTIKWFAKPLNRYRDVLRWYLTSVENTNPATRSVLPWDGRIRARPLPEGNLIGSLGPLGQSPTAQDAWFSTMRRIRVRALWGWGWMPKTEEWPDTNESWQTRAGPNTNGAAFKNEIALLKQRGVDLYLYLRNYQPANYRPSHPLQDEAGKNEAWAYGADSGVQADFGDAAFRSWYLNRAKQYLTFFDPPGLAWDVLSWWELNSNIFSGSNRQTNNTHEQLAVQKAMWDWLHTTYPEKRVLANAAVGTPSELVADAVVLENPLSASPLDYEAGKALGNKIASFSYVQQFKFKKSLDLSGGALTLTMTYKATPMKSFSLELQQYRAAGIPLRTVQVRADKQLQFDGKWHTQTISVGGPGELMHLDQIYLSMVSGPSSGASFRLKSLQFGATNGAGGAIAQSSTLESDTFPRVLDDRNGNLWFKYPLRLDSAGGFGVRSVEDPSGSPALEFFLSAPNQWMTWVVYPRRAIVAAQMQGLSQGGCLGGALFAELFPLNDFSAVAMGTPLLVGSHDVETGSESGLEGDSPIYASAWADRQRLLIAAYNRGGATQVDIRISKAALAGVGFGGVRKQTLQVIDQEGRATAAKRGGIEQTGDYHLRVPLGPKEGVLYYSMP